MTTVHISASGIRICELQPYRSNLFLILGSQEEALSCLNRRYEAYAGTGGGLTKDEREIISTSILDRLGLCLEWECSTARQTMWHLNFEWPGCLVDGGNTKAVGFMDWRNKLHKTR
jgi:hypothetical protein